MPELPAEQRDQLTDAEQRWVNDPPYKNVRQHLTDEEHPSLNLCAKTEYACLALVELARRHASGTPAPVREVAVAQRIPEKFLVQILHQLKSAGLVVSARGASGGYLLARDPEETTLDEVIEAMEGRPSARPSGERNHGERPTAAMMALSGVWREIDASVSDLLRATPLSELARRCADADPMYYI